jgi:hypothetical protein
VFIQNVVDFFEIAKLVVNGRFSGKKTVAEVCIGGCEEFCVNGKVPSTENLPAQAAGEP